jgi:hypothetical protein
VFHAKPRSRYDDLKRLFGTYFKAAEKALSSLSDHLARSVDSPFASKSFAAHFDSLLWFAVPGEEDGPLAATYVLVCVLLV